MAGPFEAADAIHAIGAFLYGPQQVQDIHAAGAGHLNHLDVGRIVQPHGTGQIAGCQTYQLLGVEGVLNLGSLAIVGEYQTIRAQRSNATDLTFGGGYVYAAWFLTGEHQPWDRKSGTIDRRTGKGASG